MCAPTANYSPQDYGTATENLTFECDKIFSCTITNLHQQNLYLTSGIIFVTSRCCTVNFLLYPEFLLYVPIRKVFLIVSAIP